MSFLETSWTGTSAPPRLRWDEAPQAEPMTRPIHQVKADFFKTLAHPARIRVLEVLRGGEHSVGELIPEVGLEASNLSQQLAVLRRANIIQARRQGTTVRYSVADKRIFKLLEVAKAILTTSLAESSQLLAELQTLQSADQVGPPQHDKV